MLHVPHRVAAARTQRCRRCDRTAPITRHLGWAICVLTPIAHAAVKVVGWRRAPLRLGAVRAAMRSRVHPTRSAVRQHLSHRFRRACAVAGRRARLVQPLRIGGIGSTDCIIAGRQNRIGDADLLRGLGGFGDGRRVSTSLRSLICGILVIPTTTTLL